MSQTSYNSNVVLVIPLVHSKPFPVHFLFPANREKMPFHHVTAGLLYKGNYLSQSLSDTDGDPLASISVEELGGKTS